MGLFDFFFSSGNSQNARKGQALSSTNEAFSLPTSSPGLLAHPDSFNPEMLGTPGPDPATSPYTYPPSSVTYAYSPTSTRSRQPPLLPLHHANSHHSHLSPPVNYPPLAQTWDRLRAWLAREYPELGDTLNYGMLPQDLANIEMQFGFRLPAVVRESYLVVDGQEAESSAGCPDGLFFGLTLLPLEDVLEEWRFWREVDDDPATGANPQLREVMQSVPPGWIRRAYSQRGWLPLITDKAGNYIGVDLSPGEGGSVGQVIVFGRDFDSKVVLWRGDGAAGWAKWLASFVDELESGEGFEIGHASEPSEGSEDDVGYESYFYDGNGRGQGDGGGDSGSGGIRMTGEYRGWSPLEAWADRSLRKWYEAGAIPHLAVLQPTDKSKPAGTVGLGVKGFAGEHATEVAVPVLVDGAARRRTPSPRPVPPNIVIDKSPNLLPTLSAETASRPPAPIISVTKPPAPLPVGLPTAHDIVLLPASPPAKDPFDSDLEAGNDLEMREVSVDQQRDATARRSSPRSQSQDATSISLPNSPPQTALVDVSSTMPIMLGSSRTADLLTDPLPALDTVAIEPSPSHDKFLIPVLVAVNGADEEEEKSTAPTIRLVGGGGASGSVDEGSVLPDDDPDEDIAGSDEPGSTKQEKKRPMSAGFKKLGNLGAGMRKKDASGAQKEFV